MIKLEKDIPLSIYIFQSSNGTVKINRNVFFGLQQ